jgi:predicted metal-dependent hydrolase
MARGKAYAACHTGGGGVSDGRTGAYASRHMDEQLLAREIPYTVRRSTRARRVRVNVHAHTGVEVVLPERAPDRAAAAAVSELRPWIERRLQEARDVRARIAARAGTVPYLGRPLELIPQPGRTRAHRSGERLLVPDGDARAAIERFYRRSARAEIGPRLDRATALAGTAYSALDIRAQRTRWASCSPAGRMSFNWRLLLAPERVLEYVVWHEVCHLEILDHSPRFWSLLERRWPGYREDRAWLSRHGATLVL